MMIDRDSYTGDFYWREDEVARRLFLVEGDVRSMVEANILLQRRVSGIVTDDEVGDDPYLNGYECALVDYTEELLNILHNRFPELIKKINNLNTPEQ